MLPGRVAIPSRQALRRKFAEYEIANPVAYALNTALAIGQGVFADYAMHVEEDDSLEPICWSAFPVVVDGTLMVIDFSDYLMIEPGASGYDHWLRFHYTSAHRPFGKLGPFPCQSFHDWSQYLEVDAEVAEARSKAAGDLVLANQTPGTAYDSRYRRRMMVRGMLHYHFPGKADFQWTRQAEWWRKGKRAACYVHVPGSTENMIDRGWAQMLALGVPVVSPVMHDYLGARPPIAGVHYIACRDDYADLVDVVSWCQANEGLAHAIGASGREFFREHATPPAIWSMVNDRLTQSGSCIDCDVPVGVLGCKHPA